MGRKLGRPTTIEEYRKLALAEEKKGRGAKRQKDLAAAAARRSRYRLCERVIEFSLPLPPLLNSYYQPVVVGGHYAKKLSPKGVEFRERVIEAWEGIGVTFEGKLAIDVEIVLADRREPDLDGYWKALLDALEHAGAYGNDQQIREMYIRQDRVISPGWTEIQLGPKPGERQRYLFTGQP